MEHTRGRSDKQGIGAKLKDVESTFLTSAGSRDSGRASGLHLQECDSFLAFVRSLGDLNHESQQILVSVLTLKIDDHHTTPNEITMLLRKFGSREGKRLGSGVNSMFRDVVSMTHRVIFGTDGQITKVSKRTYRSYPRWMF